MAEDNGRDYFMEFLEQKSQRKPQQRKPDVSILTTIEMFVVATPKKTEIVEKIHPFIKMANEKKTKLGIYAEEIIDQRKRCSTYQQIALEEQQKMAEKLNKVFKKSNRKDLNKALGIKKPQVRRTFKQKMGLESESQDQGSNKLPRRSGPPYQPNVIGMDELFKKNNKGSNKNKEKYHAGSRSRSKRTIKQNAFRDTETHSNATTPDKSLERDKSEEKYLADVEKTACKTFTSPLNRLLQGEENQEERYLIKKADTNYASQQNTLTKKPGQSEKIEEMIPPKRSEKLNIDSSNSNEFQDSYECNKEFKKREETNSKPEEQKISERVLLQQQENAKKKDEKRKQQQEQKRRIDEEIERRKRELIALQEEIKRKQRIQKQIERKQLQKQRMKHQHSKQSFKHHRASPRSSNGSMQEMPKWRKEIQKITHYDPHAKKYQERDRERITESNFCQMNAEEAYSRKMGKREEELQEIRHKKKSLKKNYL